MDEKLIDNGLRESQPDRKKQSVELCVFLFLIMPSLIISFFAGGKEGTIPFPIIAVSAILRDLALVGLILYFVWSNQESLHQLGLFTGPARNEVLLGIVLYIPFFFVISILETLLVSAGLKEPAHSVAFLTPNGLWQYLLAIVLVIIVAISEELIFRGYLILRFTNVTGNVLHAAILSSFIFSLGHGYEGSAGVVTVGIMGFLFAMVYLWRMNLLAPIILHFMQDFIGIIIVPLFTK